MQDFTEEQVKEQKEEFLHLCYEVFEKFPKGKELLAKLVDSLILKTPVVDPTGNKFQAGIREGQNSIIRSFGANIEHYKKIMNENAKKTSDAKAAA